MKFVSKCRTGLLIQYVNSDMEELITNVCMSSDEKLQLKVIFVTLGGFLYFKDFNRWILASLHGYKDNIGYL